MPDTNGADAHLNSAMITRPNPATREQAAKILKANDWTMNEFVEACLSLLTKNPDPMLARLAAFKPARRRGRPPKPK